MVRDPSMAVHHSKTIDAPRMPSHLTKVKRDQIVKMNEVRNRELQRKDKVKDYLSKKLLPTSASVRFVNNELCNLKTVMISKRSVRKMKKTTQMKPLKRRK